jgi:hypothetical protein
MSENNKNTERKYNLTLAGVWEVGKQGNLMSMVVDSRTLEALKQVKEGGKIFIRHTSEGLKMEKGEKFPDAFVEYMSAESVAEFAAKSKVAKETRNNDGF